MDVAAMREAGQPDEGPLAADSKAEAGSAVEVPVVALDSVVEEADSKVVVEEAGFTEVEGAFTEVEEDSTAVEARTAEEARTAVEGMAEDTGS